MNCNFAKSRTIGGSIRAASDDIDIAPATPPDKYPLSESQTEPDLSSAHSGEVASGKGAELATLPEPEAEFDNATARLEDSAGDIDGRTVGSKVKLLIIPAKVIDSLVLSSCK